MHRSNRLEGKDQSCEHPARDFSEKKTGKKAFL